MLIYCNTVIYISFDTPLRSLFKFCRISVSYTHLDVYKRQVFDVMMPKKDGFTLAQDVRAANAEIPIIFLTAKTLKEDIQVRVAELQTSFSRKQYF